MVIEDFAYVCDKDPPGRSVALGPLYVGFSQL
jgi:hypothetical protein